MITNLKNCLLLDRRINGFNLITEIKMTEDEIKGGKIANGSAIIDFDMFLEQNHIDYNEAIVELAQVLKVPCEKFRELIIAAEHNTGFITVNASNNILSYLKVRANQKTIGFLESQWGDAGTLNKLKE